MRIVLAIAMILPAQLWAQGNLDKILERLNSGEIPYISVEELKMRQANNADFLLLDARELEEFKVSHIADANFVGSSDFSVDKFIKKFPDREKEIIVYCSIGVRSENIGEELKDKGYRNVFNLYGGIFEWINNRYNVVDLDGSPTRKVHAYSKRWGKLLKNGEKVYSFDRN